MTAHSGPLAAAPVRTERASPSVPAHQHSCVVALDQATEARVAEALRDPGMPLDSATREGMERGLGGDFSSVRVHTQRSADHSTRGLDALAYTVGSDIVFAPGRYAPYTPAGRRLLAHELGHVRQQRAGRRMVLRQPASAPVTTPAGADQRFYVETLIKYLRGAADYYALLLPVGPTQPGQEPVEGIRVRVDRLGTQLAGWLRARDTAANLIGTALGGDQDLTEKLRAAYVDAVRSVIDAAAREGRRVNQDSATGPSPRELYLRHLSVIHEWAWPRSVADPAGNRLLDAIPAAERAQVRADFQSWAFTTAGLDSYFHPRVVAVPLPANTTVVIGPGLAERLRRGLTGLAANLATAAQPPLQVNSSVTLVLDLGRYGGDYASYRFTYLDRAAAAGRPQGRRELLVERLGSVSLEQRPPSQQTVPQSVFARHGFVRGTGWADDQFAAVQSAISQVPESTLSAVRGITFVRIAGLSPQDPKVGASYDVDTHAINVYDLAFAGASSLTRRYHTPGERQSSELDRLIAHEIGHALDDLPLRPLRTAFQAGITEQQRFHPRPIPGSRQVTLPSGEIAGWRALQDKIRQRKQALQAGRSESGARQAPAAGKLTLTEQLPAGEVNAFRAAAALDGPTRITEYSDKAWEEYFAESFSLYISEPDTLARLRPNVYDYFARKYPDPARPLLPAVAQPAANPGRP